MMIKEDICEIMTRLYGEGSQNIPIATGIRFKNKEDAFAYINKYVPEKLRQYYRVNVREVNKVYESLEEFEKLNPTSSSIADVFNEDGGFVYSDEYIRMQKRAIDNALKMQDLEEKETERFIRECKKNESQEYDNAMHTMNTLLDSEIENENE